ncbi:MAG: carboxypeptidase-like regulatory domain-containing protein [Candidatus Sericytochromatia bacterium]
MVKNVNLNSLSLLIVMFLTSCNVQTVNNNTIQDSNNINYSNLEPQKINTSISGQVSFNKVNFSENKSNNKDDKFKAKAYESEVIANTEVSVLYPSNYTNTSLANTSIAVGLTDSIGKFNINFEPTFSPIKDQIYILEARKRIGGEGNNVIALKTFIKWTGTTWTSITGTTIYINKATTALGIMSGYSSTILNPSDTIAKLDVTSTSINVSTINTYLTLDKLNAVTNLVDTVITNNQDPISEIKYISNNLTYNNQKILYDGIILLTNISGKVYDVNGNIASGATVTAKSIDPSSTWVGTPQTTGVSGSYTFNNVPVGIKIIIDATQTNWTTQTRTETVANNSTLDPTINVFDFKDQFAIQDAPEIVSISVSNRRLNASSLNDSFDFISKLPINSKPTPQQLADPNQITNVGNIPTNIPITNAALILSITFSEAVNIDDIKNYLRITAQSNFDNKLDSFTIIPTDTDVNFIPSSDSKSVNLYFNKPILTNKINKSKYMIDFSQPFRDLAGNTALNKRYFRFAQNQINDFVTFYVNPDITQPRMTGITARDGGSTALDTIEIRYSESMDSFKQTSYTALLQDPANPSDTTKSLWYRDANTVTPNTTPITSSELDNNATIFGYSSTGNASDFKGSYMIGRVKASDISANTPKTSILGSNTRTPINTAVKSDSINNLLRNVKFNGINVTLELDPSAFDINDRIIVSGANSIIGSYINTTQTPSINESLSVTSINNALVYSTIYDPVGNLLSVTSPSTTSNITVNNSQRVSTAF